MEYISLMSELGLIAISLALGILLALLVIAGGLLAWQLWRVMKITAAMQSGFPLLITDLRDILKAESAAMEKKIAAIHGDHLERAATAIIAGAKRIEGASLAFAELTRHLLSEGALEIEKAAQSGLAAEDYAPNPGGERYITQNKTVAADAIAAEEQQAELNER